MFLHVHQFGSYVIIQHCWLGLKKQLAPPPFDLEHNF